VSEIVSIVSSALAILGAILGVFLWLQKRLGELERELGAIRADLKELAHRLDLIRVQGDSHGQQLRSLFRGISGIVGLLARVPGIPPAELTRMLAGTFEPPDIDRTIRELMAGNPFSLDETNRLRIYYGMARRGEAFSDEQARDFYLLSQRATEERPTSDAMWTLFLIASAFLGLYASARQE
jgi:hypothetical protein